MSGSDYVKEFIGLGQSTGSTTVPNDLIPRICSFGVNSIDQGWRSKPIPFSSKVASLAQTHLLLCKESGDMLAYQFPKDIVDIFGNELKRLAVAIDGYLQSSNPLQTFKFLLDGLGDLEFATKLKKIRMAALTRRVGADPEEDDGLQDYLPSNYHLLNDIGDYFNYKYWFRWEEPEPEDWKFGLTPFEEPSDEIKERWEDAFERVIPVSIKEVQREEVLLSTSSSSSKLESGKASKVFKDKSDPKKNYFSKDRLKGWRTLVYKGPTETRDAVTLTIACSNTVKWIEKQCASIAANTKYSAYGLSDEAFHENLARFYQPGSHYYNRDLTKEGIMKPRWIIKSMANVFKRKYPGLPIWDYFSIYDGYELNVDNVWYSLPRGHGLGQANALTTLMQCGTFEFLKELLEDNILGSIDARFYNDDATIKSDDDLGIISYSDEESDLLRILGLEPKNAKTYSSPLMILCEQYYPIRFGVKESYTKYIRRLPFSATNILVAKAYFHLLDDPALGSLEVDLKSRFLSFWGYEFSPREYRLPSFAGGWSSIKFKNVNLDFLYLEEEVDQHFSRGMNVGKPILKPRAFSGKTDEVWEHPIFGHIRMDPFAIDKRVYEMFDIQQPLTKIAAKYHRSLDDHATHKWLQNQLIKRWNLWMTPTKPLTLYEVWEKVIKDNPYSDYIPPAAFRKDRQLDLCMEFCEKRPLPPEQPNKLLASLGWFSGNIWINKVINYPYLVGEGDNEVCSPEKLSKFQESVLNLPDHCWYSMPERDFTVNGVFRKRNYVNDYNVLEAWMVFQGEDAELTFPEPLKRSLGGQLKYEASHYLYPLDREGDQVYWDHWAKFGRTIPLLCMFSSLDDNDWEEIWETIKDQDILSDALIDDVVEKVQEEDSEVRDFWTWRTNGRTGEPKHLSKIFYTVDNCIMNFLTFKSLHIMSTDRDKVGPKEQINEGVPAEDSALDILYKRLTGVSGFTYCGFYVYGIPDTLDDVLGSDSEDGGGALAGLFG